MILVDTNVLMYAAGAEHPHKAPSVAFLERVASGEIDAVIDAEVLQEILHRYRALDRWGDALRVFDLARTIFPVVLPVTEEALVRAAALLDAHPRLMARDGVHAAVALENGLDGICSFDTDFDVIDALERIAP